MKNQISQANTRSPQANTSLHKAIQGSSKNRNTSLVHKPSPRSADILVCCFADFPVCFPDEPQRGSIVQPSGCEGRATLGQPNPNTPNPESGCISSSIPNLQFTIFNLQFVISCRPFTSTPKKDVLANRQGSYVLGAQHPSRVIKASQG
jgi:hypothetical protein